MSALLALCMRLWPAVRTVSVDLTVSSTLPVVVTALKVSKLQRGNVTAHETSLLTR